MNPPVVVKGLTTLNKELYRQVLNIPAARVLASKVGQLRTALDRNLILTFPRIKTVINDSTDPQKRLLLLNPDLIQIESRELLLKNQVQEYSDKMTEFKKFESEGCVHELILDYDYWNSDEILAATLPDGMDVPSSFETIGHIAHLNLRPEHEPFKHLIGSVILDKNPAIKTVVNKVGAIEATFRFFQMELLAGLDELQVEVKEEGCIFTFDYSKVYWNSRLQHEHRRLVQIFKKGERVCDLFCGVGPFSIPAAKKGCLVYANDLNPESVKYLEINKGRNKIPLKNLTTFNSDARDFIMQSHNLLNKDNSNETLFFDHYIMNLPASAHEFLDSFNALRSLIPFEGTIPSIWVHCYVFCKPDSSPIELVESELKCELETVTSHYVRNVSPNKDMYCVSFKLPKLEGIEGKRPKLD
jgi:tRNA (guanine37-N1)-methyltransferase